MTINNLSNHLQDKARYLTIKISKAAFIHLNRETLDSACIIQYTMDPKGCKDPSLNYTAQSGTSFAGGWLQGSSRLKYGLHR